MPNNIPSFNASSTAVIPEVLLKSVPDVRQTIALADTIANKLNPFGELRDHKRSLKGLNERRSRIRIIALSSQKKIQEYRSLGCLTRGQSEVVDEMENRCKRMGEVLARLDEEIAYVECDAVLERVKKMGRFANLAAPCGGRILGLGACAAKAVNVAHFALFGQCQSEVKADKIKAIAKQIAIEGAKILACAAFGYAVCYAQSCAA